jgi:glucose dehydrogenase
MCTAQKTLKSMPSTPDINPNDDDLDETIYSTKPGTLSPISSPTIADRHSSIVQTMDENFNFDQQSTVTQTVSSLEQHSQFFFI